MQTKRPNWFPLHRQLIESEEFIALTPIEKLYYFLLLSEYNLRGPFFRSDEEIAVTLKASIQKVRQARRKFVKLGWIEIRPGFRHPRKRTGLATEYERVQWAEPEGGDWFARMHRFTFEAILHRVRNGTFSHAEALTYVCLFYLDERNGGRGSFTVAKSELRRLTGVYDVVKCMALLHEKFQFDSGAHLFEFEDFHQTLAVQEFRYWLDPSEDETNAKLAAKWADELRAAIEQAKALRARKAKARKGKVVRLAGPGR